MKVLCLIDGFTLGGAERQLIGLAALLKDRGYEVDLACYYKEIFYKLLIENFGLKCYTLKVKDSPLSKLLVCRKLIKNRKYDWVIAYKTGPNLISCMLKLTGLKFYLIVSERNTTQHIGFKEKIQFQLYRTADYVVPNSNSQALFIKEHFSWLKKKTIPITNFTDTTLFAENYVKDSGKINILTTARIARQKNIIRYLEAIDEIRKRGVINVHFDWYGDVQSGQEDYGEKVLRKVKELELEDCVEFHPATSIILEKYQQCDIFCLPSNYEGFPNVICEAMSCGKPIICSRVCDNPYIVKEGVNALMFDNTNVGDIADKLEQICSMSKDELCKWGHRSREIAVNLFSQDIFVEKYIKLIKSLNETNYSATYKQ